MDNELINIYIDRLLNEACEGLKSRLLLETRLKYTENLNQELQKQIDLLKKEYEEYKLKNETLNKQEIQKK